MRVVHLARRFVTSISRRPLSDPDEQWARSFLAPRESELWDRFSAPDRRHAVTVARRFVSRRPLATREEVAGALLHDIGKVDSDLGTTARVLATIVGPRTRRFRMYHAHEEIGAEMLRHAGSSSVTVDLVRGDGDAAGDLRAADDV